VAAYSVRLKLGAMFSNYNESTSIRLNGIDPKAEDATTPGLRTRIVEGAKDGDLVKPGEVMIPDLLARGMKVKVGDTVVLVATNKEGSVNGKNFTVRAVLEPVTGPGGRDGYIHTDDARELLRMDKPEAMEIAIRLHDASRFAQVFAALDGPAGRDEEQGRQAGAGTAHLGVADTVCQHRQDDRPDDAVHPHHAGGHRAGQRDERDADGGVRTHPRDRHAGRHRHAAQRRILGLYVGEGLLLGLLGAAVGVAISLAAVALLNVWPLVFPFGRQLITLHPTLGVAEVVAVALMVVAVAVLASLQPAWRASRMDPITALRHV
jgi:putative ABC transport system permease protein